MASFSSEDVEKVVAGTEALKVEEVVLATTHSQEAAAITTATTTPATEEHKKENTAVETPLPLIIPEEDTKKEEVKPESQASSSSSSSSPIKSKPPHLVGDEVPATPNTKRSMREGQFGHLTPTQEEALQHFQIQAKPRSVSPSNELFNPPLTLTFSKLHPSYPYPSDLAAAKYTVETVQQCALRFLRARGFDVVKALVLLSECNQKLTEMRAAHWASCDPDTTLNCDTAALRNFYPHIQRGFDKFNRPILFEHTGGMNPTAVLQMTSKQGTSVPSPCFECITPHTPTFSYSSYTTCQNNPHLSKQPTLLKTTNTLAKQPTLSKQQTPHRAHQLSLLVHGNFSRPKVY